MQLVKKKVSFDIDVKILSDIQSFCKLNNRKVSDFYRIAAKEKLERENNYVTIFVSDMKGSIKKFTADKENIDIEFFDASHEMKVNVNAAMEGIITMTKDSKISDDLKSYAVDNKIYFFTQERYI